MVLCTSPSTESGNSCLFLACSPLSFLLIELTICSAFSFDNSLLLWFRSDDHSTKGECTNVRSKLFGWLKQIFKSIQVLVGFLSNFKIKFKKSYSLTVSVLIINFIGSKVDKLNSSFCSEFVIATTLWIYYFLKLRIVL